MSQLYEEQPQRCFRFLWAKLQLLRLRSCDEADVDSTLKTLPKGLHKAYERILMDLFDDAAPITVTRIRAIFEFILVANPPLSPHELAMVFCIDFGNWEKGGETVNLDPRESDPADALLRIYPGLLRIVDRSSFHDTHVQFAHPSVQDYLLHLENPVPTFPLDMLSAHITLDKVSLIALDASSPFLHPLGPYAVDFLDMHVSPREPLVTETVQPLLTRFFHPDSTFFANLRTLLPERAACTSLHWAVRMGLVEYARKILARDITQLNAPRDDNRTPLYCAADLGYRNVACVLLEHNADINASSHYFGTPLCNASRNGHIGIVRLLLKHNADINASSRHSGTPLCNASENGYIEIVHLLLDHNADINASGDYSGTPLCNASGSGHIEIVHLLLDHNADINASSENYGTPLCNASENGHIEIVHLLLNHNADINASGDYSGTPLCNASEKGHVEIVHLLLDHNADINASGDYSGTPLYNASGSGHIEIVHLLLDHNVDINASSVIDGTPLDHASKNGHIEIVRLLLKYNADINASSGLSGILLQSGLKPEDASDAVEAS
jgi:ankyrin repeat protein